MNFFGNHLKRIWYNHGVGSNFRIAFISKKNGFTITWIEIVIRHRATSIFNSIRLLILIFPMAFAILLLVWWLMHLSLWGNYFVHRSFFFFIFCHEKHDWWSKIFIQRRIAILNGPVVVKKVILSIRYYVNWSRATKLIRST